jgi:uncharacterized protein DUF6328
MSSEWHDGRKKRYSSEHYDPIGAGLDWFIILAAGCTIFFGFLLNIALNPPTYFAFFDKITVLAAVYAVTVATSMFIVPIIYHMSNYRWFDVERNLSRSKQYVLIGIICLLLAVYLILGLTLNSKLPALIAYSLAALPIMFIFFIFMRNIRK